MITAETAPQKIKAAVYIKHQGVFDDPNNHLETKVKRLLAGSIENLDFDNISVITDKSRLTASLYQGDGELISPAIEEDYVRIWSIIMSRQSAKRFRLIFFSLIFVILAFGGTIGWLIYKFYPQLHKR